MTRARAAAPKKDPKTGTWSFVIDDPRHESRKQVRRRGFATKNEALAELNRIAANIAAGTHVDVSSLTVETYLRDWLTNTLPVTVAESTAFSYRRNLETHVIPRIGGVKLQKLTGPMLNRLYSDLLAPGANRRTPDKGLSRKTVNYVATILHRAFGDAVRHGLLARNPADLADPPTARRQSVNRETVKVWTAGQLGGFLRQSEAESDRDFALWRLIASTGMRRGEALGLRWSDLELEASTVTITQQLTVVNHELVVTAPKTAASLRTVALDDRTVAALRSHRARRAEERLLLGLGQASPTDLVFAEPNGDPLHPEATSKRFDRRAKRYGLPHIGVHGLRHTWATLALQSGVHPRVVQERLGHSSIAVTLGIYSHVLDGQDLGAAKQVAALFDDQVVTGS
jgi:integrase